jgi:hypothetical protein
MRDKRLNDEVPAGVFPSVRTAEQVSTKFILATLPDPINDLMLILYTATMQFVDGIMARVIEVELEAGQHSLLLGIVADAYSVTIHSAKVITKMFCPDAGFIAAGTMGKLFLERVLDYELVQHCMSRLSSKVPIEITIRKHMDKMRERLQDVNTRAIAKMQASYDQDDMVVQFFTRHHSEPVV